MSAEESNIRIGTPTFDPGVIRSADVLSDLIHKVGHEIGNPLTAIISLAAIIERFHHESTSGEPGAYAKKTASYAGSIMDEAWKISALSERLVMLLSQKPGNVSSCDLLEAVEKAVQKLRMRQKNKRLDIVIQQIGDGSCEVAIDSEQLNVLIIELIVNAQNALLYEWPQDLPPGPISAFIRAGENSCVMLISNEVPEPRALDISSLFDPFVTTNADRKHLGLGLTVCWAILKRFDCTVRIIEQPSVAGRSFTVEATFPRPTLPKEE